MSRVQLLILACGVVVGGACGAVFSHSAVRAQASYTECGFLTIPGASNGAEISGRPPANPIRVAPGWTPIGGGTYRDGLPGVVVCR